MPGMERQTINKDPLQGKKIVWIMGMISNDYKRYPLLVGLTNFNLYTIWFNITFLS